MCLCCLRFTPLQTLNPTQSHFITVLHCLSFSLTHKSSFSVFADLPITSMCTMWNANLLYVFIVLFPVLHYKKPSTTKKTLPHNFTPITILNHLNRNKRYTDKQNQIKQKELHDHTHTHTHLPTLTHIIKTKKGFTIGMILL